MGAGMGVVVLLMNFISNLWVAVPFLILLGALGGFIVHPNVAAVLAVDQGPEPLNNRRLESFLREHRYPLDHVPHVARPRRVAVTASNSFGFGGSNLCLVIRRAA